MANKSKTSNANTKRNNKRKEPSTPTEASASPARKKTRLVAPDPEQNQTSKSPKSQPKAKAVRNPPSPTKSKANDTQTIEEGAGNKRRSTRKKATGDGEEDAQTPAVKTKAKGKGKQRKENESTCENIPEGGLVSQQVTPPPPLPTVFPSEVALPPLATLLKSLSGRSFRPSRPIPGNIPSVPEQNGSNPVAGGPSNDCANNINHNNNHNSWGSRASQSLMQMPYLTGCQEWERDVRWAMDRTVNMGEGNCVLLVGGRGVGKSAMVNNSLSRLSQAHGSDSFLTVRLSGFSETTDRLVLKEVARQLKTFDGNGMIPGLDVEEGEDEPGGLDPKAFVTYASTLQTLLKILEPPPPLAPLPATQTPRLAAGPHATPFSPTSALGELLTPPIPTTPPPRGRTTDPSEPLISPIHHQQQQQKQSAPLSRSKPIIFVLDEFDLFASHPRQSFLYCLLDCVQGGRRGGGMMVIGNSARTDCLNTLEKRVKSRCQSRVHQVVRFGGTEDIFPPPPPPAIASTTKKNANFKDPREGWKPKSAILFDDEAMENIGKEVRGEEKRTFCEAWNKQTLEFLRDGTTRDSIEFLNSVNSYDVRRLLNIYLRYISELYHQVRTKGQLKLPCLSPDNFAKLCLPPGGVDRLGLLNNLTTVEYAALIASKHLTSEDHPFNLQIAYDVYVSHAKRGDHARDTGRIYSKAAFTKAFERLRSLEILLPAGGSSSTSASYNPTSYYQSSASFKMLRLSPWISSVDDAVLGNKDVPENLKSWCKRWAE